MKNKIFLGLAAILFIGDVIFAHPPDSLKMSFDTTGTIMTVRAFHSVKMPNTHFILQITVDLNGKQLITQNFSSQLNKNEQVVIYKIIDAKKNDKIGINAQCNIMGKKKETFIYTFSKQ